MRDDTNSAVFDKWTLPHVASGFVAARLNVSFTTFTVLAIAYEVFEYSLEYPSGRKIFGTKRPESLINVAGDIVANTAGYWLGQRSQSNSKLPLS